jgi:predicted transcriptional regulator
MQIVADILHIAAGGVRKTRIMYLANLSFALLSRYLGMLLRTGLVQVAETDEGQIFVTTSKGKRFLEDYEDLERIGKTFETKRTSLERQLREA